jgi:frataxin
MLKSTSRLTPSIVSRSFSSSIITSKGITPESSDPQPKKPESHGPPVTTPTEISIEEYHQVSDDYIDAIVHRLEQLQEAKEDVDVEFSVSFPLLFPPMLSLVSKASPSTIILTSTFHSQTTGNRY